MSDDEQEEFNPTHHKKLLSEIQDLVKTQHIKKPTRSEPSKKLSEFNLAKTSYGSDEEAEPQKKKSKKKVTIESLTDVITKNTKQKQISKQLKNAFRAEKTLKKPLERVHADRLQRTVAYEETKKKLGRWDAVVTKNQLADQVFFPLKNDKADIVDNPKNLYERRYRTEFGKKLQEIFPQKEEKEDDEDIAKLSLREMIEKRKELQRIKMREAFKISKARKQGKIKSKTYHKLKKREKLKEKMKEFEDLKATDPELALKELEKIEKQRVEERATLRHKNTGTWAKNLKVRAKYDKNVQQDLEAQLAIGKELTQKQKLDESSDSEEEEVKLLIKDASNPWISGETEEKDELDQLYTGYKKFWKEKNENKKKLEEFRALDPGKSDKDEENQENGENGKGSGESEEDSSKKLGNFQDLEEMEVEAPENPTEKEELEVPVKKSKKLKKQEAKSKKQKKSFIKSVKQEKSLDDSDDEDPNSFLNDIFDKAEEKLKKNVEQKYKKLKNDSTESVKKTKLKKEGKIAGNPRDPNYLGFKKRTTLNDVDSGLLEGGVNDEIQEMADAEAEGILKEINESKKKKVVKDINPDSFLTVKSKHLITAIPKTEEVNEMFQDEDDVAEMNKMSLAEAFEDDDIIQDFIEEQEVEKNEDPVDLLPGWGSWAGHKLKIREPKKKQKLQEKKKEQIILTEDVSDEFKKHQVSDLPFPFKSVKDFEASIRAPVGREFVPETAHAFLTMPEVVTKMGTIIEPMTEDVLMGQSSSFTFKGVKNIKKDKNSVIGRLLSKSSGKSGKKSGKSSEIPKKPGKFPKNPKNFNKKSNFKGKSGNSGKIQKKSNKFMKNGKSNSKGKKLLAK